MVFKKLKFIIKEQTGIKEDEISMESSFVKDLGCDSLDLVLIAMAVEEDFKIEIPEDEAEKLVTVGEVVRYIEGKI
jgi:acyl carrier protein